MRVVGAVVILSVVVVYHVLRLLASQCTGAACDWYIPFSLFLPLIAILLAGLTGLLTAVYGERSRRGWALLIGACAILAVLGPILAALVLSDNDTKVWVATALVLTVPVAVLMSVVWQPTTIRG
jgi:Na+/melibiose symporter-like transporter